MNVIKKITDEEFGLSNLEMKNPRIRIGARGIVIRENGEIAVFNKKNKNEYKLPGGGVDEGEEPELAFVREVLEETGMNIKIIDFLGTVEEYKSHDNFKQVSYVYVGEVIGGTGVLNLTQKEKDEGGQLVWMTPRKAYLNISNCINDIVESKYENIYHSKFIVTRDKYILEEYMNASDKVL